MLSALILLTALVVAGRPAAGQATDPPEDLAVGTIRSIVSAQAAYKHTHPEAGYACDVETLVKADMLVGSSLTVCTDETNVPRTTDADVTACFAKGAPPE